jgi:uncharacterized protein VirK/YbjX
VYSIVASLKDTIWDYRKKSLSSLLTYFLRGIKIIFFPLGHTRLNKVLNPLYSSGLLSPKIGHIYLFDYLSGKIGTKTKLAILTNHYSYFQKKFPNYVLNQIFKTGLVCWKVVKDSSVFEIKLLSNTPFENEGSLSFLFTMDDVILYRLAFTFCPGKKFGLVDEQVAFVSRIQGAKGNLENISKASKDLNDNFPPTLLISSLEGFLLSLGIKKIVGIHSVNQVSYSYSVNDHIGFHKNYDEFWETFESIKINRGDYLLSLPLTYKTITLIRSKHRNRTINKRKIRQEISRKVYFYFMEKISGTRKIYPPYHKLTWVKQPPKAKAS